MGADAVRLEQKMPEVPVDEVANGVKSTKSEEKSSDEWESASDEDASDSESLLADILQGNFGDFEYDAQSEDIISAEEAWRLRVRLREVGLNGFVNETVSSGRYTAKKLLTAFRVRPPDFFEGRPDQGYYRLLGLTLLRELATRIKLAQYNTVDDAVELIKTKKNIVVITGAGISTNLGVPDFRSKNTGFYDQMRKIGFTSPEDIFHLETFREAPEIFYTYSSPTLPEPNKSTPTHAFIKRLDTEGKLLTNYTQNIDNVEGNIGISREKLIQCHGSWATFTCLKCGYKTDGGQYFDNVKAGRVVYHQDCPPTPRPPSKKRKRGSKSRSRSRYDEDDDYESESSSMHEPGVMKPDITFFGERLPERFFDRFKEHDRDIVDLLIVIGTSLSVQPVSDIPLAVSQNIPQIAICRDLVEHVDFDVTLRGDCDLITEELSKRLGWDLRHPMLKGREVSIVEEDHDNAIWKVDEIRSASPDPEKSI